MSIKKERKLAKEIIGYIGVSGGIASIGYVFFLHISQLVVEVYCARNNIFMNAFQMEMTDFWQRRACLITAVVIFIFLCFFLTAEKFLYIQQIIHGVDKLRENDMNFEVSVEGDDELTRLAESINYLARSQRELKEKEQALKEEKDAFIRALSHDIRTPLTSVLAMSEYMGEKKELTPEEVKDYISLVKNKSVQIKILTDRLLNGGQRRPVWVEMGKLLFEQLAYEWQEILEEEFECVVSTDACDPFSGEFDVAELRRIFDNLASNVGKYADSSKKVMMEILTEDKFVIIRQMNRIRIDDGSERNIHRESYGIGVQSIERLVKIYHGEVNVSADIENFEIVIKLHI